MDAMPVDWVIRYSVDELRRKWDGKALVLNPPASSIVAETEDRYGCTRYGHATLLDIGKKSFVVAAGEADRYYLTEHLQGDVIIIPNLKKQREAKDVSKLIESCASFSNSVFIAYRDGALLPGPFLRQRGLEDVSREFEILRYLQVKHGADQLQYSDKIVERLIWAMDKVLVNL